jgi:transposase InsO family protein
MNLLDAQLAAGVRVSAAQFAREHGVSVRTVFRHRARIAAEGQWQPRSHRPLTSPTATPAELVAWIVKLRADLGPDNGADYIRDELMRIATATQPTWQVPARSTINRVLARHDLLARNPAKRPRSSYRRFSYAQPRDCYQIDATVLTLADGQPVVAFEVLDDCTRTLVACHAAAAETAQAAVTAITKAATDYGPPGLVLSDNGVAFTSHRVQPNAVSSQFSRTVNSWGTRLIHASPYHPQTCGKVERHHQTLKKWLRTQPPPATLHQLQHLLDTYRDYYNHHRRHSALPHRNTPAHAWTTAANLGGPTQLPIQADATIHRCQVYDTGTIRVGKHRIGVGRIHYGTTLTAIRDNDHATIYTPDGHPIGHATLTTGKGYVSLTRTPQP